MVVLLDMQWVTSQDGSPWLRQIAALRTEEFGWINEEFHARIRPNDPGHIEQNVQKESGYPQETFSEVQSEFDAICAFFDWLEPDDSICCWTSNIIGTFKRVNERWREKPVKHSCVPLLDHIRPYLPKSAKKLTKLYEVAQLCGVELPTTEPSVQNNVSVMRELFRKLELEQLKWMPEKKKRFEDTKQQLRLRREQNLKWMEQEPFAYLYLDGSPVFHQCGCKALLNSETIQGCIRYEKAMRTRRPCKLCRPMPDPERERRIIARMSVRGPKKLRSPEEWDGNEVITTFLLGSERIAIKRKKLVGCCHNRLHPGKMTEKLMKEHGCLQKDCWFFEKYPEANYWINQEQKKEEKKAAKTQKRLKMEQKQVMQTRKELFQFYAEQTGSPMKILRVEEQGKNTYTLFYVSEYPFRDGNRFPDFLRTVKTEHPMWRVMLRHIQDVNGHFVTIDEYAQLRR